MGKQGEEEERGGDKIEKGNILHIAITGLNFRRQVIKSVHSFILYFLSSHLPFKLPFPVHLGCGYTRKIKRKQEIKVTCNYLKL